MSARTCTARGGGWECDREDIDSRGLCTAHAKQRSRLGADGLKPLNTRAQRPMCTARGDGWTCDRRSKARSLCSAHYNQVQRGQQIRPLTKPAKPLAVSNPCPVTIDGWECGRSIHAAGMCITHVRQKRAGKPLTKIGVTVRRMCEAKGDGWECDQPSTSRGMCRRHALQRDTGRTITPHGAPKQPRRGMEPQSPQCVQFVDGARCDRPSKARGLCDHHYRQSRNGHQPTWPMTRQERARRMQEALAAKRNAERGTAPASEPWVPGTLDHKPRGKAVVRELLDIGPVVPPSRVQVGRTLAALQAVGATRAELADIALMLTGNVRNSEAVRLDQQAA